jgi:RNA polymerase sigma-70 factor (ECF subfamily)
MVNLTIDHLRSRRAERVAASRLAAQPVAQELGRESGGDMPNWAALVAPLPDRQRLIATLYYGEDWPVERIADALGIRAGTVKSALAKARNNLAAVLTDDDRRRR